MAEDDDEFEMLCKSFEGTECPVVVASIESKDTIDIIDEIDSFLEEDDITVDVNNKASSQTSDIHTDKNSVANSNSYSPSVVHAELPSFPSSSPILDKQPTSLSVHPHNTRPYLSSPSDPLAKHYSEIAPILANLPDDQARPVVEQVATDGLDLSLLDKEEWEEEWEMREFTMSDILSELKEDLLDSDDEDDGNSTNDGCPDHQYNSLKATEIKKSKREFENLESRIKVTEERYYQSLEDVWREYQDNKGVGSVPPRSQMTRPRIFKDKLGAIVGYETLQEYVDNNHPLWGPHRELFNQFLFKERSRRDIIKFVAKNWGNQHVNTARNLTVFSSKDNSCIGKIRDNEIVMKHVGKVVNNNKEVIRSAKATLVEMYANSSNTDCVQENERARAKMFEAQLKEKLLEQEKKRLFDKKMDSKADDVEQKCDLCGNACFCMIGRKRRAEEQGGRVSKQQFLDTVEAWRIDDKWGKERIAEAMFGVLEAFELQSCYTDTPYFSNEQVSELTSLEDVHDMILDMYDSPYRKENAGEEKIGWMNQEDLENF